MWRLAATRTPLELATLGAISSRCCRGRWGVKRAEHKWGRWIPEQKGRCWATGTYRLISTLGAWDVSGCRRSSSLVGRHIGRCLRHLSSGLSLSLVPAMSHGTYRPSTSLRPRISMWSHAIDLHVLVCSWLALDTRGFLFLPMGLCANRTDNWLIWNLMVREMPATRHAE